MKYSRWSDGNDMKTMKKFLMSGLAFFLVSIASHAFAINQEDKVVSLGGNVTELVYALGQQQYLVGTDLSSVYPAEAKNLPQVGYYRHVATEGVVSLKPTIVLASENAGPKKVMDDIKSLGINLYTISDGSSIASLYQRIREVAKIFGVPEKGEALVQQVQAQVKADENSKPTKKMRAVLIVNHAGGMMAAGNATAGHEVMSLAGLENIFQGQQGYKPISLESLMQAQPELIVITEISLEKSGGMQALKTNPAIADTPAVKNNRIFVMDDLLAIGLGPRVGEAVKQLREAAK